MVEVHQRCPCCHHIIQLRGLPTESVGKLVRCPECYEPHTLAEVKGTCRTFYVLKPVTEAEPKLFASAS